MRNGDYSQNGGRRTAKEAIENPVTVNRFISQKAKRDNTHSPEMDYLKAKMQEHASQIATITEGMGRLQGKAAWFLTLPKAARQINLPVDYLKELIEQGSISALPAKSGRMRVELNILIKELQKLFRKSCHLDGIINPKPSKQVIWGNVNSLAA